MTGATQRKKQAILDAASVLFSERGVAGTGIEAIAELAQVSRQSVYTYYTSKEGILQALLESFYQRGAGQWLSEHAEAPPIRSRERLEEELFSFMASGIHALMNPDYLRLMRIVVSESEANPGLGDEFRRTVAGPMMEAIRSILSRVERQPAPDDLDIVVRFAVGPLLPYVLLDGLLRSEEPLLPGEKQLRVTARLVATAYWYF